MRRRADSLSPALPVLIGLALAEGLAVIALLRGWWAAALALHLLACFALVILPRGATGGRPAAVLRLTRLLLPALGPAAAAGGLIALFAGRAAAPAPLHDTPDDPIEARLAAVATARNLPEGLLLEALGDALRWGNARQKALAIDLAVRDFRTGGEALLRLAQDDPDPAVRARADAARPIAERRLIARADALRGGDARTLARHMDRAAYSGLLDPPRATACRMEAVALWRGIAAAQPHDAEACAALGRGLLALGRLGEARTALEAALANSVATPAVLGWLAECLFRARDFAALDALVARWEPLLAQQRAGTAPLAAAWRLWLAAR